LRELVPLAWLLSGCATIFSGTTDRLKFESDVPGVRLTVDGHELGELPLDIDMSRSFMGGRQFNARFEKPGYLTQQFVLTREFNPVAVLDVTSIPTSGGIDVLTGAIMRFAPKEYFVRMRQAGVASRSTDAVRFALVNFRALQKDIARGGGETLAALAEVAGGRNAALVTDVSLQNARALLDAPGAPSFVQRFNALLAARAELRGHQL